jgi:hypothetical protein
MSLPKFHAWRSSPAVWLWSVAIVLPPTLAAIAASKPSVPSSPEVTVTPERVPLVAELPQKSWVAREARRVLIDDPGQDPLSAMIDNLLLIDPVSRGGLKAAAIAPAPESNGATNFAEAPRGETTPDDDAPAESTDAAKSTLAGDAPGGSTADLSPELLALRDKVQKVLAMYYPRHQSARDNNPWEVMHAIIAYGVHTQLFQDRPDGEKVNAIGWMCYNYPCAGQRMLFLNRGKVDARRGVGVQGHGGQFLAILAQSHVMSDYPMLVEGKKFTLADLIEHEKETCVAGEELTFKLIALMHYLDSDETWTTPDGQEWSIQRLIHEELKAPIRGAACGGTHRLMGFSYAVNKRIARGEPIEGEFRRAQAYTQDYHRYTFSLQNPDGSFSTAWFERRASDPSIDRRLKTSGHILEWITFSLSDDELRDPRMIKAVDYLSSILLANDRHTWEIGPKGHALHALALYKERVFKGTAPMRTPPLAGQAETTGLEARRVVDGAD